MEFIKTQQADFDTSKTVYKDNHNGTSIGIVVNDNGINKIIFAEFVASFKDATLKVVHVHCVYNDLEEAVPFFTKRKYVDNKHYCNSLGLLVTESEALNEDGMLKDGYFKHFDFWFNAVVMNTNTSIYEALVNDMKLDYCGIQYA